jgi:hypothetical protein
VISLSGFPGSTVQVRKFTVEFHKCQLAVCTCNARAGDCYCSDDCKQAEEQAITRDFCQCAHAGCGQAAFQNVTLPGSMSFAPGRVTIEYSSVEELRDEAILLAKALDRYLETRALSVESTPRRSPALARTKAAAAAQSA